MGDPWTGGIPASHRSTEQNLFIASAMLALPIVFLVLGVVALLRCPQDKVPEVVRGIGTWFHGHAGWARPERPPGEVGASDGQDPTQQGQSGSDLDVRRRIRLVLSTVRVAAARLNDGTPGPDLASAPVP